MCARFCTTWGLISGIMSLCVCCSFSDAVRELSISGRAQGSSVLVRTTCNLRSVQPFAIITLVTKQVIRRPSVPRCLVHYSFTDGAAPSFYTTLRCSTIHRVKCSVPHRKISKMNDEIRRAFIHPTDTESTSLTKHWLLTSGIHNSV